MTPTQDRSRGVSVSQPKWRPAWAMASSNTPTIASTCLRDAISGTTPPKRAWKSIDVATTFAQISPCESMTAIAVSSHDDSIESTRSPAAARRSRTRASRSPTWMGHGLMEADGSTWSSVCSASAASGSATLRMSASCPSP